MVLSIFVAIRDNVVKFSFTFVLVQNCWNFFLKAKTMLKIFHFAHSQYCCPKICSVSRCPKLYCHEKTALFPNMIWNFDFLKDDHLESKCVEFSEFWNNLLEFYIYNLILIVFTKYLWIVWLRIYPWIEEYVSLIHQLVM